MAELVGIILLCLMMIAAAAWGLNKADKPGNPEEDREQMEFLREWNRKHKK